MAPVRHDFPRGERGISRRDLLKLLGGASLGLIAAACAPGAPSASSPAPTKPPAAAPTAAARAPAPTTAPTQAQAAARPTTPPSPAPAAPTAVPTKAPTVAAPARVTMWTWMNPEGKTPREVALKQILTSFQREYPTITVEVTSVPWQEIDAKWRGAAEVGSAPDVVWLMKRVPDRWKFLTDLDQAVLPKMAKEEVADLFTLNTDESRVGRDVNVVFPVWPSIGSVLFYRKDVFAKNNIQAPLQTWDDFLKAGKALTLDSDKDGKTDMWGYVDSYGEKVALVAHFFYALADLQPAFYDVKTKKALFDTDGAVKAAQLAVDTVKEGIMPRDAVALDYETMLEQFYRGRFAMSQGSNHRYGSIRASVGWGKENVGIMPWPTWKGGRAGPGFVNGGWNIGITRGTRTVDAAGTLLRHFMSKESSKVWLEVGEQVPNRKSLGNDPTITKPGYENLVLAMRVIAEYSYDAEPTALNTGETPAALGEALQKMMLDGKLDRSLLQKANERINRAQEK